MLVRFGTRVRVSHNTDSSEIRQWPSWSPRLEWWTAQSSSGTRRPGGRQTTASCPTEGSRSRLQSPTKRSQRSTASHDLGSSTAAASSAGQSMSIVLRRALLKTSSIAFIETVTKRRAAPVHLAGDGSCSMGGFESDSTRHCARRCARGKWRLPKNLRQSCRTRAACWRKIV
jgi:hypothetical protein